MKNASKTLLRRACVIAVVATILADGGGLLLAQGRGGKTISQPGAGFRTLGAGASTTFSNYSFGIGSLTPGSSSAGGDILRSSMASSGMSNFAIGKSSSGAPSPLMNLMSTAPALLRRPSAKIGIDVTSPVAPKTTGDEFRLAGYLDAISSDSADEFKTRTDPIISLVPSAPGQYRTFMELGEAAFKVGNFGQAFGEFQLASEIGDRDWVSLLSMSQAKFASGYSYASSAYYLRQAMKYFPELPRLPLRPRDFYGDQALYARKIIDLEAYIAKYPGDGDGPLLLAYYRWFDQKPAEAAEALKQAMTAAGKMRKNEEVVDTIETFWGAMVDSGKVTGTLPPLPSPATAPAPTTQPDSPTSVPAAPSSRPAVP